MAGRPRPRSGLSPLLAPSRRPGERAGPAGARAGRPPAAAVAVGPAGARRRPVAPWAMSARWMLRPTPGGSDSANHCKGKCKGSGDTDKGKGKSALGKGKGNADTSSGSKGNHKSWTDTLHWL